MTTIYNKEISPWEKKSAYFKNVRFGYMENTNHNIENIMEGIRIQNESLFKVADPVFVHPETKPDALLLFGLNEDDIAQGVSGLKASFEWGISDVLWLLEQQKPIYRELMATLSKSENLSTAQFKINAQNAYSKGWFEEALKDYHKVEKREEADFTVYTSMGMIYLFHLVNKEKALEYFGKASEWARTRSLFYTSYALLFQVLIKKDLGANEEAETIAKAAVAKAPDFSTALYELALLSAMLDKTEEAMQSLGKAAAHDVRYYLKALSDPVFGKHKAKINSLIAESKRRKKELSEKISRQITEVMNDINSLTRQFNDKYRANQIAMDKEIVKGIGNGLEEIQKAITRDSLMDYALVEKTIRETQFSRLAHQAHKKIFHNVMAKRKEFTRPFEQKIEQVRKRCNLLSSENTSGSGQLVLTLFYFGLGAVGGGAAVMVRPGMSSGILGAILGFVFALVIQFLIKRYGETYEIDYSGYDGYSEIESFIIHLKKLEKKLPAFNI